MKYVKSSRPTAEKQWKICKMIIYRRTLFSMQIWCITSTEHVKNSFENQII